MAAARAAVKDSTSSEEPIKPRSPTTIRRTGRETPIPIKTTTKRLPSSIISMTLPNNPWTSFPDSENHLEKREWALISSSLAWSYLNEWGFRVFESGGEIYRVRVGGFGSVNCYGPVSEPDREFLSESSA